jgi:SAM-dependent methyltransferase
MKTIIRNLIPKCVTTTYRNIRSILENEQNKARSTEVVFSDIYIKNKWGGDVGEYCSGSGSRDQTIVSPYIEMIFEKADSEHFRNLTFLDLGCGDFMVGRQLLSLCSRYIGVDIVKPLIESHQKNFADNDSIEFRHINIIDDDLPTADVCFVRQVFQHLSNDQILSVLPKLAKFKFVLITEHYPNDNDQIQPNKDKIHGGGVRLAFNSGVYLTKPPFNLLEEQLSLVLEVPGSDLDDKSDPGVIRTFIYKPFS